MEKELIEKIAEMIESSDPEMHQLAIEIFRAHSSNYRDYWLLRTIYSPSMFIDSLPNQTFTYLINNVIDRDSIDPWYNLVTEQFTDRKLGREELIKQSCVLATKEEQRDARRSKKYK